MDLAHRSQRSFVPRNDKPSEWPQFAGNPRIPEGLSSRIDRRTVTTPTVTLTSSPLDLNPALANAVSGTSTPPVSQHSQITFAPAGQGPSSRRGSPSVAIDGLSTARSVPATPLSISNGGTSHMLQAPGTPLTPDTQSLSGRLSAQGSQHLGNESNSEIQPSLSRMPSSQFDNTTSLSFEVCHRPFFIC